MRVFNKLILRNKITFKTMYSEKYVILFFYNITIYIHVLRSAGASLVDSGRHRFENFGRKKNKRNVLIDGSWFQSIDIVV